MANQQMLGTASPPEIYDVVQEEKMIRDYEAEIAEYWPTILNAWHAHAAKRPMIECDLASRKVYAHDSTEYIDSLSDRTRERTRQEFARTMAKGGIMVFVKDSAHRVLQSYTFSVGETATEKNA